MKSQIHLELSYSTQPIDARAWIDPEVVQLAGINIEELAQFTQPEEYIDTAGSVSQPNLDSKGPHMSNYPDGRYAQLLSTPDEAILAASQSVAPVTPGA